MADAWRDSMYNEVVGGVLVIIVVVVVSSSQCYAMGRRCTTVQQAAACQAARLDYETKARRAVVGTASSKQASSEHRPKMRAA